MINRDNYLAVKEYLRYQSEVRQHDPDTVDAQWLWLKHLLEWADATPLAKAETIRPVFPRYLAAVKSGRGKGEAGLIPRSIERACAYTRAFLLWHARTHRDINGDWIDTLRPGRLDALPRKEHQAVTLEMVRSLLAAPVNMEDVVVRRDRAAAAFLFLSGMRATAFCTLPIRCVNIEQRIVMQYPTMGVKTKNRKAGLTRLLEIDDLMDVVVGWDAQVRLTLPDTAPWYPVIENRFGMGAMLTQDAPGQRRAHILRARLFRLFDAAGLPRLSPHKFRHGHARYGLDHAQDIGDLKAVSMNMMHSSIGITDSIYAVLSDSGMQERIARLSQNGKDAAENKTADVAEIVKLVMGQLSPKLERA